MTSDNSRKPIPGESSAVTAIPPRARGPVAITAAGLTIAAVAYVLGRSASHTAPRAPEAREAARSAAAPAKDGDAGADKPAATALIKLDADAADRAGIKTAAVTNAPLAETLTVTGSVEVGTNRSAIVTPPASGRIVALEASPGDSVRAGQVLATLDSPEIAQSQAAIAQASSAVASARAQVQTAEATVMQSRTKLGSAQSALDRQRELAGTGALSQPSLQAAQGESNAALAELAQARTALDAQTVIVVRDEQLFQSEVVARAELDEAKVSQLLARTRVTQAEVRARLAGESLKREQKVFQGGLLPKQAIQSAAADARAAEGDVRQAEMQVRAAQTGLQGAQSALEATRANANALSGGRDIRRAPGRIEILAPLGGVVADRPVTLGQAVERGAELFIIQNLRAVQVTAIVPEADVARIHVGEPVEVTVSAYPRARFRGTVQSIGSQVDEKTRALPVRCLVSNPGGMLNPGMFASVHIQSGHSTSSALSVPDASVDEDGDKRFVYVAKDGGYEKRAVRVGRTSGRVVEITEGLKAGEQVATAGMFLLKSESKKSELKGDSD
jgi:cobalt-zinc-cadmium efflux system membrane fusion protein